jgi:hypothetical protein
MCFCSAGHRAILKLGGEVAKSTSRLNFPITDYDLHQIAAMSLTHQVREGYYCCPASTPGSEACSGGADGSVLICRGCHDGMGCQLAVPRITHEICSPFCHHSCHNILLVTVGWPAVDQPSQHGMKRHGRAGLQLCCVCHQY